MSSPCDPSKNGTQDNSVAVVCGKEKNRDAENVQKWEDLLNHIESGFMAILKDLMKKFGEPLTDHLKVLLECSICKGLITSAVTRHCLHTFCGDCLTHWINTSSSSDCPICRNEIVVHVKNPIIDEVVKLLVDTTFTEKEKEERSNEIHQLSSAGPAQFRAISENLQGEVVVREVHPDTSILGKATCVMMAHSFISELWDKFHLDINGNEDSIPDILLRLHLNMLICDWNSLPLVYESISKSAVRASLYK